MSENPDVEQQQSKRLEEIRTEVEKTALIGALEPIETLNAIYADNPGFLSQLPRLFSSYSHYRPVRGDGICFYRAALFQLGSALKIGGVLPPGTAPSPTPLQQGYEALLKRIDGVCNALKKHGFDDLLKDFMDSLATYLTDISDPNNPDPLVGPLIGGGEGFIIYGLRLCTCLEILDDPDSNGYSLFIEGGFGMPAKVFCDEQVLRTFEEADEIQILALSRFLGVTVQIVSVDAHNFHINSIPEASERVRGGDVGSAAMRAIQLPLLLRPGHYDCLSLRS